MSREGRVLRHAYRSLANGSGCSFLCGLSCVSYRVFDPGADRLNHAAASVALLAGLLAGGGDPQMLGWHGNPILATPHGQVWASR